MSERNKCGWLLSVAVLVGSLFFGWAPATAATVATGLDLRRDATVNAIEQAMPSVVNIATVEVGEVRNPILDWQLRLWGKRAPLQRWEEPIGVGSGVIIDEEGYLLTNLHVLERANEFLVKLWNGKMYKAQHLTGTSQRDVALLKIVAPAGEKFQAMKFAQDDDLLLGETVIALGNPYGLGGSVTRGILSSKNRRPSSGNAQLDIPDWLQTDADINPGNSGGPLISLRGEMIGINAAVYREGYGMGVGFAIPIKQINAALSDFFTPEAAESLWLGLRLGSFYSPLTITSVQPRSPAEQAGLRKGQRILAINGQSPGSMADFLRLVLSKEKDRSVTLQIADAEQRRSVTVRMMPCSDLVKQRFGLTLRSLNEQEAASLRVNPGDIAMVEQVEKDSPADKAKLQAGFLLTRADDRKGGDLLRSVEFVASKQPGDRLLVSCLVPRNFGASAGQHNTTLTVR